MNATLKAMRDAAVAAGKQAEWDAWYKSCPVEDSEMSLTDENGEGSFITTVIDKVKSLFKTDIIAESNTFGDGALRFYKGADGEPLRFVTTVSNNFKDREAETITEEAHHEYVNWATTTNQYPELWLWHAGAKSKWGQVDWLDVCDGFLIASGTVDVGKEHIAKNLAKDGKEIGVSHGFYSRKSNGIITQYRTFEISPLPMWAAANEWTSYNILDDVENGLMPFSKQKRDFLIEKGMTAEAVSSFEKGLGEFANELKARGVDWKDYQPEEMKAAADAGTEDKPKVAPKKAAANDNDADDKGISDGIITRIDGLETSIKQLTDLFTTSMKSLSQSQDERTASFFKNAVSSLPQGYRASSDADNTPAANAAAAILAEQKARENKNGWFQEVVMGGAIK